MFGIHDLALFVVSGVALNVAPGPDTIYVAGRAASGGWRAGALAALGVSAGCFTHILSAALGLSALMAASATAFAAVKLAGAAYLVWAGLTMLLARGGRPGPQAGEVAGAQAWRVFRQGFFTNALNPKVALFFLAFLPQFIDQASPDKALAFVVLGCVFNFTGTLWMLFVAWSSARLAVKFTRGGLGGIGAWMGRAAGALFVFLGLRLALAEGS